MALVRASSEAIGIAQVAAGWGTQLNCAVHVDSSAALAVTARRGNGRLRHVRIGHLWVQEVASEGEVSYQKVAGLVNPADLLTKHSDAQAHRRLFPQLGQAVTAGHANNRLRLSGNFSSLGCSRIQEAGKSSCGSRRLQAPEPRRGVWIPSLLRSAMRLSMPHVFV